ncbi:hypothetical protein CPB83DRAFT_449042 [Crepidotus variabilis]|uniref:Uncharacterized protein n=1 Tax=Crepidotus variabilis TaxID=179855 RepID=A0A9P6JNJ9_9AGAR|nr:hypothetical protein CPB83DRAFT_449042 [Crepidotus variabilis]
MNILATAASIIGAALVGRPLSSDALKLGVGAAKSSTVDSYFGLERLLALVSVLTTVGLTLVADAQYSAFGVQVPYTAYPSVYIPKATRTTRLAATASTPITFVDTTNVGLWIAGMVLAFVGGSGTALILCGGQSGQNRSSSRSSRSVRQGVDDTGGHQPPFGSGTPQPWPPPPPADPYRGRGIGSHIRRSMKSNNIPKKSKSREDPPPPPPPATTTACGDDDKPEVEQLLLGILVGFCLSVIAKVINKYIRNLGKKSNTPKRNRTQPARTNLSKTAARALAICVLPVVPLTLFAGCAWNQGPPHTPGKRGSIKVGVIVCAATLATLALYILFVMARTVLGILARFYLKMTEDYDDFDEDVDDHTCTGDTSGDDNDDDDDDNNFFRCDIEDIDNIDDDDLGSDFFGERYDISDPDFDPEGNHDIDNNDLGCDISGEQNVLSDRHFDPNCSHADIDAESDIYGDEADPIYFSSENEGDENDLDVPDVLHLDPSLENISATQPMDVLATPPRRPVPQGEPEWTPNDDRRAFTYIRRRAIMAGDSPIPGGLRNSPPSPIGLKISPLKLPSRETLDRFPSLLQEVSHPNLADDSDNRVSPPTKYVRFHNQVTVRTFTPDTTAADTSSASDS